MKIYATRHAQSTYNRWGRCNSNPEVPVRLTSRGVKQAEALATEIADLDFDVVVTSELPRTKQTAAILNRDHGKPTIVEPRFNDIRTGFEGWPVALWLLFTMLAGKHRRFGTGESIVDADARVLEGLKHLTSQSYDSVLVVAHQHTIDAFQAFFVGKVVPSGNAQLHVFETAQHDMIEAEKPHD